MVQKTEVDGIQQQKTTSGSTSVGQDRNLRLQWAHAHQTWTVKDWNKHILV